MRNSLAIWILSQNRVTFGHILALICFLGARDPATAGGERPISEIGCAPELLIVRDYTDRYPAEARQAYSGPVRVGIIFSVSADGKVSELRIRYVRSAGPLDNKLRKSFVSAARDVTLNHTKMVKPCIDRNGKAQPFLWETSINFFLK